MDQFFLVFSYFSLCLFSFFSFIFLPHSSSTAPPFLFPLLFCLVFIHIFSLLHLILLILHIILLFRLLYFLFSPSHSPSSYSQSLHPVILAYRLYRSWTQPEQHKWKFTSVKHNTCRMLNSYHETVTYFVL